MRLGTSQSARPADYDRNSIVRNASYQPNAIAPHVQTQRWTYTVPTGKRTRVASLIGRCIRDGAGGAAGLVSAFVFYTPFGGSGSVAVMAHIWDSAIGARDSMAIGTSMIMNTGDVLAGFTTDNTTGGTMQYEVAWSGNEFDS